MRKQRAKRLKKAAFVMSMAPGVQEEAKAIYKDFKRDYKYRDKPKPKGGAISFYRKKHA